MFHKVNFYTIVETSGNNTVRAEDTISYEKGKPTSQFPNLDQATRL
jgi:hypothetical protein